LDARRREEAVQATMSVGDLLDDVVQKLCVPHIDATVVQLSSQFFSGTLLNPVEIRGLDKVGLGNDTSTIPENEWETYRLFQTVEGVHDGTGF
jgi:hypothetical protein